MKIHELRNILIATLFITCTSGHCELADTRNYSAVCNYNTKTNLIDCDYRYSLGLDVKEVSLKVENQDVQIDPEKMYPFPAESQTSSTLILVDTSDPKRKQTVEKKNKILIQNIIDKQKTYQKIGLATFDSDLQIIVPLTTDNDALKNGINSLKASGLSTEFYKSILKGIEVLKKSDSDRKGLIIISDGKDEDTAYKREDVLKAAKDSNINILSIGYLEKPTDTPYLQTLERLATDTYGAYINATDGNLNEAFKKQPLGFIEKGGRISFDGSSYYGNKKITIALGTHSSNTIEIDVNYNFQDNRNLQTKLVDFIKINYIVIIIFIVILIIIFTISFIAIKRRNKLKKLQNIAILTEINSQSSRFKINKTSLTIGRSNDNDIVLTNDTISAHHAEIHRRREGDFFIVDLASTNGTFVNENRIKETELKDDDLIEIGEVRFKFNTLL